MTELQPTKLAFTPAEAARVAGIGRTYLFEEIRNRRLVARKAGRRTLIEADELRRWIKSLPMRTDVLGA